MKIHAENIGVHYMINDFRYRGLKDVVLQKLKGICTAKEFWALDNISFELKTGDFLGIVGNSGAGKSTLLKTITGIIPPSRGLLHVEGKVVAILEFDAGFDGDMTVKENTFLRGTLLGYSKEFIKEAYQSIIEFAELEEFQDRFFRQLSSGMKSRLDFSFACLAKPDILIIDEVLSVCDESFLVKSEKRMQDIIDGGAITILVSHSLKQIKSMCNKVLWLDRGKQMAFGDAKKIIEQYEDFLK